MSDAPLQPDIKRVKARLYMLPVISIMLFMFWRDFVFQQQVLAIYTESANILRP